MAQLDRHRAGPVLARARLYFCRDHGAAEDHESQVESGTERALRLHDAGPPNTRPAQFGAARGWGGLPPGWLVGGYPLRRAASEVCEGLAEPLPPGSRPAKLGKLSLPFRQRVTLYRYVLGCYQEALREGRRVLPRRPASPRNPQRTGASLSLNRPLASAVRGASSVLPL